MPIPDSEYAANAEKKLTDSAVAGFLDLDRSLIRRKVVAASLKIEHSYRIIVCGGAGAAKTLFSEELSSFLDIPTYDLDNYIPEGWTENEKVYNTRFWEGVSNLKTDVALDKEWIIEHIEAAGPAVRTTFKPLWGIHLNPGIQQLKLVSRLRDAAAGTPVGSREGRALSSNQLALKLFLEAPGKILVEGNGWLLKRFAP